MSQNMTMIWTVVQEPEAEGITAGSSNGTVVKIRKNDYDAEAVQRFRQQYDQGEIWGGWLLQRITYDGKMTVHNPWRRSHIQEEYLSVNDYVVSENGILLGFYIDNTRILWIEDFIDYDSYDGVINENTLLSEWKEPGEVSFREYGNLRMTSWF